MALADSIENKITEINNWYITTIAAGYDTGFGYSLDMSRDSQIIFSLDIVLMSNKIGLGLAEQHQLVEFIDSTGLIRELTIDRYIKLLVEFGTKCRSLLINKYKLISQALIAADEQALELIVIPD